MPICKFCNESNLEWYQNIDEKWKLGIKLDINNFRPHKCIPKNDVIIPNNKRNWSTFICGKCGLETKQNVKLFKSKSINLCLECTNLC